MNRVGFCLGLGGGGRVAGETAENQRTAKSVCPAGIFVQCYEKGLFNQLVSQFLLGKELPLFRKIT